MSAIFKKLNLGSQSILFVSNAPSSFEPELTALANASDVAIHRTAKTLKSIEFALAFVQTLAEIEAAKEWLPMAIGDAVVWFAYPKQSSQSYSCEFNRDTGWATLGASGFEGVRQVAIDADWSALRFRRTEFIKTLTRRESMTISEAGRTRTQKRTS